MAHSIPVGLPGGEHDEIAIRIIATKCFAAEPVARKAVQQADVRQKAKRIEGNVLRMEPRACLLALIDAHHGVPSCLTGRQWLHSQQARCWIMPKQGYVSR